MAKSFSIPIIRVVDLLGLRKDPSYGGGSSLNVQCPFCDKEGKYHMNINLVKNVYSCPRCGTEKNTGALDLYGRVRHGTPHIPGRNGNGKELYAALMAELEGTKATQPHEYTPAPQSSDYQDVLPADDAALNAAYSALLALPTLHLIPKHFGKLKARGLNEEAIARGRYRSLRDAEEFCAMHPDTKAVRLWLKHEQEANQTWRSARKLRQCTDDELVAGRLIVRDMLRANPDLSLKGVPGFFRVGQDWCFVYTPGLLIPTVSMDGNVVGAQIRRDVPLDNGLRYMTLSSKGLPDGPTTKIARAHFVCTGAINESTKVLLTEGPLKGDVILHLMQDRGRKNLAVIAIQGVNNVKELPDLAKYLTDMGVQRVYGALDMDKLVNMSVAKAERRIAALCQEAGLEYLALFWDRPGASKKYSQLLDLAIENGLAYSKAVFGAADAYDGVYRLAKLLSEAGVEYNIRTLDDGTTTKEPWDPNTKGLDDWLWSIRISLKGGKGAAI